MNRTSRYENVDDEATEQIIAQSRFTKLNPQKIPLKFRHLINYAQQWGISDDGLRGRNVDRASDKDLKDFITNVQHYDELLDEWLASAEAHQSPPSHEYVAYSCMRLACDHADWLLKQRKQDQENREKLQLKLPLKEIDENGS
jgi:hypothetical protein